MTASANEPRARLDEDDEDDEDETLRNVKRTRKGTVNVHGNSRDGGTSAIEKSRARTTTHVARGSRARALQVHAPLCVAPSAAISPFLSQFLASSCHQRREERNFPISGISEIFRSK